MRIEEEAAEFAKFVDLKKKQTKGSVPSMEQAILSSLAAQGEEFKAQGKHIRDVKKGWKIEGVTEGKESGA